MSESTLVPTIDDRVKELERRIALLVRVDRMNLLPMSDARVQGYCADFQELARTVERENPVADEPENVVPLNGSISQA